MKNITFKFKKFNDFNYFTQLSSLKNIGINQNLQ